jgi:hypothetical protein
MEMVGWALGTKKKSIYPWDTTSYFARQHSIICWRHSVHMLQRACFLTMWIYIYILYWLVVGNIFFICPCIGNNHPNRKIFFRGVDTGYPSLRGYYHTIPVFLHPSPAPRSNIAGDFSHECFHCSPIKWYIPNFIFRCRNQTLQTSLVFPASWNCSPLYKVVPHS